MKKRVFLKRKEVTMVLSKSLLFLLVIASIIIGCKKAQSYEPVIPYNTTIDTATLKIKVINPPLASGVDVTEPSTKVILFLFDSKNLFLTQASYNGISTEDTSIVLNGLPMGHYTALLVVDGPGITNLNYLAKGVQSYLEVVDTLQSLLTGTYVGTYQDINYVGLSQTLLVNQKYNEGILSMQPLYSIISQINFDLSQVFTAWQKTPQQTDGLHLLVFQNGGFVRQIPVKDEDIAKKSFSVPIAQGANYSFLFTDLTNQPKVCKLLDSLIKGTSTIADVQTLAERYNNNIRMGVGVLETTAAKTVNSLPQATITNLTKTIYNGLVENAMAETIFTIDPAQNIPTTKPSNSDGLAFLEFQNGKLIRKMPVMDDEFATGKVTAQILKGEKYDFLLVDLLQEPGQFELKKITDTPGYSVVTINSIQGNVEPYNNKNNSGIMRLGVPAALPQSTTINKDQSIEIINGLSVVTFNLANLVSKPITPSGLSDGFALLEFKDGVLIKKTDIPYFDAITNGTTIPNTYTTSVVKSTKYSFWFVDLVKSADGTFQLKNEITKNGKLVGNISIAHVKNIVEPYLNQNMRMGTIAEGDLTTPTANLSVSSLIQQVKLKFTGSIGCNNWDTLNTPNTPSDWSVLILDQSGYYKRTAVRNVADYNTLFNTPFNIFTGSKYYIVAVRGLGTDISKVELATTNYNTLATINTKNPAVQPNLYSWVAIDSCLPGQTTYENHATSGTITLNATNATNSPIKVLTQIDKIPVKSIGYLRSLLTGYNSFGCNPINIKGIVTMNGKGENDLTGWYILQDPNGTTTPGAIPIQFKTDPNLNVGDQVTITIQDGDLATVNNMLLLRNVTYTLVTKDVGTYSVTPKTLGNITGGLSPSANDEAMVVSITNVEFRYWKGQSFYDLIHLNPTVVDYIELRDASVAATTPPSTRAMFRLKMNTTLSPTAGFGFVPIPAGKGSVTGILAKNSTNQYAIQPRNASDINFTNVMTDRVDKGVIVDFNPYSNNGAISGDKTNGFTTGVGVCREIPSKVTFLGNYIGYGQYNTATPGPGFYTNIDSYSAITGILLTLSTMELIKNEDIRISVSGGRQAGASINASDLVFKVQYSIDNGSTWNDVASSSFTFTYSSVTSSYPSITNVVIPGIGGNPNGYNVLVKIQYVSGRGGGGLANVLSWRQIKLTQIP